MSQHDATTEKDEEDVTRGSATSSEISAVRGENFCSSEALLKLWTWTVPPCDPVMSRRSLASRQAAVSRVACPVLKRITGCSVFMSLTTTTPFV